MLLSAVAGQREEASLNPEDCKLLKEVAEMKPLFENFLKITNVNMSSIKAPAPSRTISEVLETMLVMKADLELITQTTQVC